VILYQNYFKSIPILLKINIDTFNILPLNFKMIFMLYNYDYYYLIYRKIYGTYKKQLGFIEKTIQTVRMTIQIDILRLPIQK
jgi:hypothetical protein